MKTPTGSQLPERALSDGEVSAQVKQLVAAGRIAWTSHAEIRMAKRGFEKAQVKECLLVGIFGERPYIPNRRGPIQYKFSVRARVDRQAIEVVASLIPERNVIVVTVKRPS